jgi:DNA-binding CsgD family transcriptional regulator
VAIDLQVGIARYERGELAAAATTLRRGAGERLAEDDELRVSLQAAEMTVVRSLGEPSEPAEQLLAETSPGRTSVERLVLAQAAFRGVQGGEVDYREVLALARRALPPSQPALDRFDRLALPLSAMAHYLSDELDEVEARLTEEIERAQRQGEQMAFATASFFRGFPRYLRGNLLDAAEDFQGALDAEQEGWAFALPSAHALRAMCAIECDDLATAGELLALPGGDERWSAHPTFPVLLSIRALWHNCEGRHEQAREEITAAGERQTELGALNPSALHWQVEAAYTALAVGDDDGARAMSVEAMGRARRFGAPRALGLCTRVAGVAHDGTEGVAWLRESVEVLEGSSACLELAHSQYALAARLRRIGQRRDALDLLGPALDVADRCGAVRLRTQVAEELRVAGGRPRRARLSGRESLTPSERRVALLAAEGLSNPLIAQRLFVTRRTVETHLTHAYSKLDISTREELAGALTGG